MSGGGTGVVVADVGALSTGIAPCALASPLTSDADDGRCMSAAADEGRWMSAAATAAPALTRSASPELRCGSALAAAGCSAAAVTAASAGLGPTSGCAAEADGGTAVEVEAVEAEYSSTACLSRLRGGTVPAALASVSPARQTHQACNISKLPRSSSVVNIGGDRPSTCTLQLVRRSINMRQRDTNGRTHIVYGDAVHKGVAATADAGIV